jgi:hypothetical protein
MNNTRVVVLTVILVVCLLLMGWTVYQKQLLASRPPTPPIVVNLSPEAANPLIPSIKLDSIPVEPSELPAVDASKTVFIFNTQARGLGRVDPFIKLPFEFTTAVTSGTDTAALAGPPEPIVRGIVMSGSPFAYIEDGPGPYRKVRIGDFLAGGRIVSITERTIIINRNGNRVILRLGE